MSESVNKPEPIQEAALVVPTHEPAANLAARSNIVPDGPGTVADFLPPADE